MNLSWSNGIIIIVCMSVFEIFGFWIRLNVWVFFFDNLWVWVEVMV